MGPVGAGHYVKMVHNGVEYGMMQAYAEGFSLFDACEYELDNAKIAHLWMKGSVVRSWLCELAALAFEQEGNDLAALEPYVEDSGEGRWTVEDSIELRHPDARSSPRRCSSASPRAARTRSRRRSTPRCAPSSAATRFRRRRRAERGDHGADRRTTLSTEGLERLPVHPTTLVIFGGTGDLAMRKLLPALYNLAHEGALPERFHLIGVSRSDQSHDDYRAWARDSIARFSRRPPDDTVLDALLENVRYACGRNNRKVLSINT